MSDFKSRLIDEHSQLVERMNKLQAFIWSDPFNKLNDDHKSLLIKQKAFMESYESTLAARIYLV